MEEKQCKYCHKTKCTDEFASAFKCKRCKADTSKRWRKRNRDYEKRRYEKNKEKILAKNKKWRDKNKEYHSKYYSKYYYENKDRIQERTIKRGKENREKTREYNKKYYFANKEKVRERQKIYDKKKRKANPSYKLRKTISKNVNYFLKKRGFSKKGSILTYLPYSIDQLKNHIESLFEPWMGWNNWGIYNCKTWDDDNESTWVWNMDHIIPQSKLPFDSMEDPNFKKCWALENLRPYSAKQNTLDGNRR